MDRLYAQQMQAQEHVFRGVIGAIGGSLVGVALMLLLDHFGFVASIAGVVMAICALKGYRKLAGTMSKKGIIAVSIVMVLMTLIAAYLEWSIAIYDELKGYYSDIYFIDILISMPFLLAEFEMVSDFLISLGMLFLFTALGAVPEIRKVKAQQAVEEANPRQDLWQPEFSAPPVKEDPTSKPSVPPFQPAQTPKAVKAEPTTGIYERAHMNVYGETGGASEEDNNYMFEE